MEYIKELGYISLYKSELGSLYFSGISPDTQIIYDFILTGHTPSISPVKEQKSNSNKTELEKNIEIDGKKERCYCFYIILKSHINSPFSALTASINEFYITEPDSQLSFEMVLKSVKNQKYLIEIKNREYDYSTLKRFGTLILEEVKWNKLKIHTGYQLIYIHTTTDGYLLNFKLNEYINNEGELNFIEEVLPKNNKNRNNSELKDKIIGHIPFSKAIIRRFN